MTDARALVPVVEQYPFAVWFDLTKIRDADTVEGIAYLPTTTTIPFLNLTVSGLAPWEVVVRLEGVSAAERYTVEGKMATTWVRAWFDRPEAEVLWLHSANLKDSFGRVLGDIRTSSDFLTGLANDLLQSPFGRPYVRELDGVW